MTTPKIRAATEADVPAIAAIYRPAVLTGTASFELEPPDVAEMLRRFRAVTEAGYPYFVAELDGRVAIYIAPGMQGKGIGRALLRALIDTCTAKGFRLMIAIVGDSAQAASIALHRRQGFTFCGTIHSVGYKFDRWLDSVIMQLPLGAGDTSAPTEIGW